MYGGEIPIWSLTALKPGLQSNNNLHVKSSPTINLHDSN